MFFEGGESPLLDGYTIPQPDKQVPRHVQMSLSLSGWRFFVAYASTYDQRGFRLPPRKLEISREETKFPHGGPK